MRIAIEGSKGNSGESAFIFGAFWRQKRVPNGTRLKHRFRRIDCFWGGPKTPFSAPPPWGGVELGVFWGTPKTVGFYRGGDPGPPPRSGQKFRPPQTPPLLGGVLDPPLLWGGSKVTPLLGVLLGGGFDSLAP